MYMIKSGEPFDFRSKIQDWMKRKDRNVEKQTAIYSVPSVFGGQRVSLGRMVLVAPADVMASIGNVEGVVIRALDRNVIVTDAGWFELAAFEPTPDVQTAPDGTIRISLQPGQWCWLPRV